MKIEQLSSYSGEAIIDINGSFSFQELVSQIDDYSSVLRKNPNIKQRVIVIDSDYSFYSIALLFALKEHNCIIVPIVRTTIDEYTSKVEASESNIIVKINDNHDLNFEKLNDNRLS